MSFPPHLAPAAAAFVSSYHAHPTLASQQQDWSLHIALCAADTGETVTFRVEQGRVTAVQAGASPSAEATIVATADAAVLCDILYLRKSPNEPYLFGELLVSGPETDFLRLDYIVTTLCG
jgi:hypothetical protein